jgi:hypothetical protein
MEAEPPAEDVTNDGPLAPVAMKGTTASTISDARS